MIAAFNHHQRGELAQAEPLYREVLVAAPRCYDALHLLGITVGRRGAKAEAVALLRRAIDADVTQPSAHLSLVRALINAQDVDAADAASAALISRQPASADAWLLRGNALQLAGDHQAAVASYGRALELHAELPAALNNQGHSLRLLRRFEQALATFERALALRPGYPMALNNLGLVFLDLKRMPEALRAFDAALAADPGFQEARSNRGTALLEQRRYAEASQEFARLSLEAPNFGSALGNLLWARRNCCDWADHDALGSQILAAVEHGAFIDTPLPFLFTSDSPRAQLRCARTFTLVRYPPRKGLIATRPSAAAGPIRIAYLSGDFGAHAVSTLLAGVIEHHDAECFSTFAVGWGRKRDGDMRQRLERAFGRFFDVTQRSDREVAELILDLHVDIAVDLTGHTGGQRTGIFAYRPAPIQVNFLGFPGTSGARYFDYVIADSVVIADGEEKFYSECVARLPHCFLPTDDRRIVAEPASRADAGLPERGFVFCAFNNPAKITPQLFAIWMRILQDVPESVLWLRVDLPVARENLLREARARGVGSDRLVFAPALSTSEAHLARYRLADLFLDTLPYGAHATACDALWAGVPVLTCRGRSFAGRVAASLIGALGLAELVADSLEAYARTARELAADSERLASIRARLKELRHGSSVFNTALYCRNLETAYRTMYSRHRDGLPAAAFSVER